MAGDPAFTELLLAMGLRTFSMHPTQIASVKQRVLRVDTRRLAPLVPEVLASDDPEAACGELFATVHRGGTSAPVAWSPASAEMRQSA